ncbi:hypothetical protein [Ensifer adhaerens]|nr:hypothetical protein [Ensifer adhaerens]
MNVNKTKPLFFFIVKTGDQGYRRHGLDAERTKGRDEMFTVMCSGTKVVVNPQGGHLEDVSISAGGRVMQPLHRAPWRTGEDNGGIPEVFDDGVAPTLQSLSGDFFCAPFGADDITDTPEHGLPANGIWLYEQGINHEDGGVTAIFRLREPILGAKLFKQITLRPGHPVVYQRHRFIGGCGALSVAHHPMLRISEGAKLTFSKKAFGATPENAVETDASRGFSALRYPQEFDSLSSVELLGGGRQDLTVQPGPPNAEDFLILAEEKGSKLGWTAAVLPTAGYIYFAVRDPNVLPFTMLWMSNGGRKYPPFSGRHKGVIGLEEGCTFFGAGNGPSTRRNWLNDRGYKTAITLNPHGDTVVDFAFGAIPLPEGWTEVMNISVTERELVLVSPQRQRERVPFRREWLSTL